jgi:CHASE1-domain containing sensor protein
MVELRRQNLVVFLNSRICPRGEQMGKRSSVGVIFVAVLAVAAIVLLGFAGVRILQKHNKEQQVMEALAIDDRIARMEAFVHLRETQGSETLATLVQSLDDPDVKIHTRAASELTMFNDRIGDVAQPLAAQR